MAKLQCFPSNDSLDDCRIIQYHSCCHCSAPHTRDWGPLWTYGHTRRNFMTRSVAGIHLWDDLIFSWALFLFSLSCSEEKWSRSMAASCSLWDLVWFSFLFSWTLDSKQEILVCHWYFPLDLCCYNTKLWKQCSSFRLICSYICWLISLHY